MTKNQSTNSSTKLSESEAIAYWEKKDREFLNQLRASGLTVTETAASDGGELTASIPQGKHPSSTPESWPTTAEIEAAVKRVD